MPSPLETDPEELIEVAREEFEFILSSQLQQDLFIFKIVFISISILFILLIIYFLKKDGWDFFKTAYEADMKDRMGYKDFGAKKLVKKWQSIKKKLTKESEATWKLALIEAEDFLNAILKRMGHGGDDLESNLMRLTEKDVSDLKGLIETSQVCQDIARDPDYRLSKEKAKQAVEIIDKALIELQVL